MPAATKATAPQRYKIREAVALPRAPRIDRELGIVYDVRVCGLQSANGRRYLPEALREARSLYEGAPVYFDHPHGDSNARSYRDHFGTLFNVRVAEDGGLIGDLKYKKKHFLTEQFLEDALDDSKSMGLSHNAEGLGSIDQDGCTVVEQITVVHSVDIVDGPATTLSLFEQQDHPMNEDETTSTDAVVTEVASGSDIDAMLADLVQQIAAHPEWSKADKIAKIKDVIGMMEDGEADAELTEAEEDGKDDNEEEMMEQLRRFKSKAVRKAAATLLQESRRKLAVTNGLAEDALSLVFLEQLTAVPTPKAISLIEDRKQVLAKAKAQSPKSFAPSAKPKTPSEIAASIDWNS